MMSYPRAWYLVVFLLAWTALNPASGAFAFQNSASAAAGAPGQVQGKVVLDSDGSAVPGAAVTVYRIGATQGASAPNSVNSGTVTTTAIAGSTGGTTATTASAATAKDGTFSVTGLAAGQFGVCVKDSTSTVIDPCLWPDSLTTVNVASGSLSSGLVVRAKKATLTTVRVNDTGQFLAAASGQATPPHVLIGAFDMRGLFHPAMEVKKDSTGITYQLAMPVDSPVRITAFSAQVKLQTGQGAAVPAQGYSAPAIQPSNQTQPLSFTFNAVGRN